jgi:Cdc6-like AAA superfamily ATPase
MSLKANSAALAQNFKELSLAWERTRTDWRDLKAMEFQEKYLAELPELSSRVGIILNELDNLMRKVKTDCE